MTHLRMPTPCKPQHNAGYEPGCFRVIGIAA